MVACAAGGAFQILHEAQAQCETGAKAEQPVVLIDLCVNYLCGREAFLLT